MRHPLAAAAAATPQSAGAGRPARGCCECRLLMLTAALLVENCPQLLGIALSGGDPSHPPPQPLAARDAPSPWSSSFGSTHGQSNGLPGAVMLTPLALNIDTYLLCHSLDGLSEVITASQASSMWLSGLEEFTCPRVGLSRDPGSKFPRCAVIGHPVITRQGRLPPPLPLDPHSAEEKDSRDPDRGHSPGPRSPGWAGECVSCHAVFKPGYSATDSPLISDYHPFGSSFVLSIRLSIQIYLFLPIQC